MHKRLTSLLGGYNILCKHFQGGRSINHAIIGFHTNIIKAVEKIKNSSSNLPDFAKTSDTVNHKIVLEKIKFL